MKSPFAKQANAEQQARAFIDRAGTFGAKMTINMRIDADLVRRMDAAAKRMGITRSAFVSTMMARVLEE
jgi:hypothetical protein